MQEKKTDGDAGVRMEGETRYVPRCDTGMSALHPIGAQRGARQWHGRQDSDIRVTFR
jgi:hypothetical protein